MYEFLEVTRADNGVATITLRHGKVNALCVELLAELAAAASELSNGPGSARTVVISGGPKIFAAGADITQFAANSVPETFEIAGPDQVRGVAAAFLSSFNAIAAIPVPTIASVSGFALGGGCELALACDLRVASTRAKFGQPEILLGIIPGGGGTQRLARLVGPSIAKDLIFTGRMIDAVEAHRIGLINEVCEPEDLDDRVTALAGQLASGPSASLASAKRAIDEGLSSTLSDGLQLENELFCETFSTDEATIGVRSFLQHGPGRADFSASN